MDIKDWIKAARTHKGWTQQQLGDAVGRTKANVGHWETGKHEPKLDQIQAIAKETGYPLPALGIAESNVEPALELKKSRMVPVTGNVKGGDDGYLVQSHVPDGFVEYWTGDPKAFALRIKGDSMHPRYRAGEFVVVTPSIEAQPGRDVVVRLFNGKCLLKQLNWVRQDEVQLLSINNGYGPMTIPMDEVECICRVAGSVGPDSMVF
ncbi:hypothetical protein AX13_09850 [Comamonas aquatica DA1877]|uniref:HTH cro/C1-type domain-containing protein n=1 Tax=Comamonas aquatica DA1877 TaxID=1457173 RepID=A0A014NHA2_9BURK|nr:LexA family transcriptional regulator [Comamonas aquatica]EXU78783.1 hypothetical protein AX13_09850 [Comamonas aquatica DA1877]